MKRSLFALTRKSHLPDPPRSRHGLLALALALCVMAAGLWTPAAAQTDAALTALRGGRYDEAIGFWEGELAAGRATADQVRHLVDALIQVGRYDDAGEVAAVYGEGDDGHELANRLGQALLRRGELDGARVAFERSIRGGAADALQAELNLAILDFDSGARASSMRRFDRFIDVYNDRTGLSSEDLTSVGVACSYLGIDDPQLFHDAVRAFDEAIAADPGNLEPRLRLGELFLDKYNSGEAGALIDDVLAANPVHPGALVAQARRAQFDGSAKAIDHLRAALEVNPSLVEARALMARLLLVAEQYAAATREAESALEINPRSLDALGALAATRYLQGDDAGFATAASRALELNPRYGSLYNTAAEMAVQNRLYGDAVELAAHAVQLDDRSWASYGTLGINQLRIGQIEAGQQNLERAFAGDPFNVWFKNTLDLLDTFEGYRTVESERFDLFIEADQADLIALYMGPLADEAYATLTAKYGFEPEGRVRVEVFSHHADFSVRTVGLAGLGALGVAFGPVVAVDAPVATGMAPFNWGSTLWHEIGHVITLGATDNRVPRWLTEGLSVFEERRARQGWGEEVDPGFLSAFLQEKLLPISEINEGFVRPRYPQHVVHSYLQASLVCELIERDFGFDAIPALLESYRARVSGADAVRQALGIEPEELDRRFVAYVETVYARQIRAMRPALERASEAPAGAEQREAPSIEELEQLVTRDGEDYVARLQLGIRLYESGRDAEAVEHLRAARELFPQHADSSSGYAYLARLYEQRGDIDSAIETLQTMIGYNETSYESFTKLADLLQQHGRDEEAADVLERAMFVNPYEIATHERLAEMREAAGDWKSAVRERRAVVALDPVDRALAFYQLAIAYRGVGDSRAARRAVLGALELAPSYRPAQELLLALRAARGDVSA